MKLIWITAVKLILITDKVNIDNWSSWFKWKLNIGKFTRLWRVPPATVAGDDRRRFAPVNGRLKPLFARRAFSHLFLSFLYTWRMWFGYFDTTLRIRSFWPDPTPRKPDPRLDPSLIQHISTRSPPKLSELISKLNYILKKNMTGPDKPIFVKTDPTRPAGRPDPTCGGPDPGDSTLAFMADRRRSFTLPYTTRQVVNPAKFTKLGSCFWVFNDFRQLIYLLRLQRKQHTVTYMYLLLFTCSNRALYRHSISANSV